MAQGKAFTPEQRQEIIQSLKDFLEMGFSRNKACEMVGLPPQTLSNWVVNDEALGMKLQGWENTVNRLAVNNIKTAIIAEANNPDDIVKNNSWKWVERRIKEFSPKQELEHAGTIGSDDKFTDEERDKLLSLIK